MTELARLVGSLPIRDERWQDLALRGVRVGTASAMSLNTATYCNDSMTDRHCASSNQSATVTTRIVAAATRALQTAAPVSLTATATGLAPRHATGHHHAVVTLHVRTQSRRLLQFRRPSLRSAVTALYVVGRRTATVIHGNTVDRRGSPGRSWDASLAQTKGPGHMPGAFSHTTNLTPALVSVPKADDHRGQLRSDTSCWR
jgi:hypothetical protein